MHSCDLYSNLIRGCCCCDNGSSLRAGAQPGAGVDAQRMLNKRERYREWILPIYTCIYRAGT